MSYAILESPVVLNRATSGQTGFDPSALHQLVPLGEYRGTKPGPTPQSPREEVIQVVDAEAVEAMVRNFDSSREILVDYEHHSHRDDQKTTAAAWITELVTDPADGILFRGRWSKQGLEDVSGLNYRFISPEFPVSHLVPLGGNRYRPTKITGAGLTNRPQLKTLRPLSNREQSAAASENPTQEEGKNMDYKSLLLSILGLAASASDAEIQAAADSKKSELGTVNNRVSVLEGDLAKLKTERDTLLNAVVESDLNTHAAVISNREVIKTQLLANRDATLVLLGAIKPAQVVTQSETRGAATAIHNREGSSGAGAAAAATGKGTGAAESQLTGRARTQAALRKQRQEAAAKA